MWYEERLHRTWSSFIKMVLTKNSNKVTDCQEAFQGSPACSILPQPSMANANDAYILQMRKLRHVAVRKQTSILGKQKKAQVYVCLCGFPIAATCWQLDVPRCQQGCRTWDSTWELKFTSLNYNWPFMFMHPASVDSTKRRLIFFFFFVGGPLLAQAV